jgi:hypothetical protein
LGPFHAYIFVTKILFQLSTMDVRTTTSFIAPRPPPNIPKPHGKDPELLEKPPEPYEQTQDSLYMIPESLDNNPDFQVFLKYASLRNGPDNAPIETPYMKMSVKANRARTRYNFWAIFFGWLTLAGYVVLPNTFTSLKASESFNDSASGKFVLKTVQNMQLLPLAGLLCFIGTVGTCSLWWIWQANYIWLLDRLFL